MTKLPINFLLYVASLGLAGGSVYLFYDALVVERAERKDPKAITGEVRRLLERGAAREADFVQDRYAQEPEWWAGFRDANFVGKLPPKPVARSDEVAGTPDKKVDEGVRVADILTVISILYDQGGNSTVIVRYKPEANIRPPAGLLAGGSAYAGPGDARVPAAAPGVVASRGTPAPGSGAMPAYAGGSDPTAGLLQHLRLREGEDRLWPDYDYIRLVEVKDDASAAVFRIETPGKPETDWRTEEVLRNELELPEEYLRELHAGRKRGAGSTARPRREDRNQVGSAPDQGGWKPVEVTTIEDDRVYVGSKDYDYLRENMQRVLQEEIGIRAYQGRKGLRGLQVTRVPPKLARFGVAPGDVILEVNGVPVRTKAQAIQTGKKQYRRGVRTFRVKILSRGTIQERTYYAPEK